MKIHELKVYPQFWPALASGEKPFEVRRDDRGYRVGDICRLREYDPTTGIRSDAVVDRVVTYILMPEDFPLGVPPGFVVLGFGELAPLEKFKIMLERRVEAKKGGDRVEAYALKLELNALIMRLQRDGYDVGFEDEDEKLNPPC